ncbi:MAG TPA: hypothetical protein PKE27_00020 [Povalibacter sp.]|uniref:DUF3800 domain-containing protein n=1 Tax=Povalibacter sp. TaxID=1962978 RepID=UPI002BCC1E63|nr:DUF3800 domain-containing protein [Povalibacter sp.]HMN42931.1 hypothetical protein [Povalibacter sp.]
MDDSGTRLPNRKPLRFNPNVRDFFALGGVLINEEDEAGARKLHSDFCSRWSINYPLHSVEIRHSTGRFTWLKRDGTEYGRFMNDLTKTLLAMEVLGVTCAIDRPGYDARYREKYGRRQWHLCQTAFAIAVERAAKFARRDGRKLRVMPERSSKADDERLVGYYSDLRTAGPPFETTTSAPYAPLTAKEFAETLHEIRFKSKSSPMGQVADMFLWPMAIAGYDPLNRAYVALRDAKRLIEIRLREGQAEVCGSKYSCFELVRRHQRGG